MASLGVLLPQNATLFLVGDMRTLGKFGPQKPFLLVREIMFADRREAGHGIEPDLTQMIGFGYVWV